MITHGQRTHYIFTEFKHVFDSVEFKDFSTKMMQHLNVNESNDPNNLGTLTDTVLPFVNGNLQNVNLSVNKIDNTVKQLSQDVTCMSENMSCDLVELKDDINENITTNLRVMNEVLKEEIGKNTSIVDVQMKQRMANWNYKLSDSLVAQADEMLLLTNDDSEQHNAVSITPIKKSMIQTDTTIYNEHQNIMTTAKKRSFDDILDNDDDNATYIIPVSFE